MSNPPAAKETRDPSKIRRIVRLLFRQTERCFALIGLATVVYYLCFDYSRVVSFSMQPTLRGENWEDGDRVLTEKVSYWFRQPRRWEVITFCKDDGDQLMKRVIGLPGERVQMLRGGEILIDGRPLALPEHLKFLDYFPYGNLTRDKPPYECGEGYYVLGDYSKDSDDSRFNGAVLPKDIVGRAWVILGPEDHRGFVNQ